MSDGAKAERTMRQGEQDREGWEGGRCCSLSWVVRRGLPEEVVFVQRQKGAGSKALQATKGREFYGEGTVREVGLRLAYHRAPRKPR